MLPCSDKRALLYGASLLLLAACSSTPRQETPGASASEPPALPRSYDQALVLMGSGDYTQSIPVLQKFIDKEPELAGPYLNLGIAYRNTGQLDAALEALRKAIELNPTNPVAHHQLAIVQRELGAFEAALEAYTQALKLAPDYGLAHRNLGILYDLYLQQPAAALNHYRTYLELSQQPDNQVQDWVVDLERRVSSAQARAEQ
jgi:tetratricopeptide (TPR) repeat protein